MANAAVIPDDQVTDCAGESAPQAKPGNAGYATSVPVNNDQLASQNKPCLKVGLTSEDSKEPKEVAKIVVQGNVARVTVQAKKAGSEEPESLLDNTPLPEDGVLSLPTADKLEEIRVIFEAPKDNATDYRAVLSVFACGHFPGQCCS